MIGEHTLFQVEHSQEGAKQGRDQYRDESIELATFVKLSGKGKSRQIALGTAAGGAAIASHKPAGSSVQVRTSRPAPAGNTPFGEEAGEAWSQPF
jgi:hypothetical protein